MLIDAGVIKAHFYSIILQTELVTTVTFCTTNTTIYVSLLWPTLLLYVIKKFWCQLPEDGEIIVPKQVAAT